MHVQDYLNALSAYRGLHPHGWVGLYLYLPTWAGILLVLAGGFLVPFGGGAKTFRIVAAPLGAVIGFVLTPAALMGLGFNVSPTAASAFGALVLFLLGAALPAGVLFFAAGLPLGMLGGALVGRSDYWLGFLPLFLFVGAIAAVAQRWVGSAVAALVGSWLFVLGVLSTFHRLAVIPELAEHPYGVIAIAVLLAVAGAAYQIAVRPTPEQLEKERVEATRATQREAEEKALQERWAKYSEKR